MFNTTPQVSSGKSRREIDLLLSCASYHLDSARTERIKALTRGEIDWPSVLRAALAHRVMPLLYKSLNTACPDNVPQAVSKQLQSHYYANAAHNLLLAGELLKILRLFERHNVPAIPYKGPVL
ncbi:MAG: nucleotidyltransferase family protein, partial [Candidatus Binatia bacterium]